VLNIFVDKLIKKGYGLRFILALKVLRVLANENISILS